MTVSNMPNKIYSGHNCINFFRFHSDYMDSLTRTPFCWTTEATRYLIKLRGERDNEFEQSGARKSQLWLEICNKMREAGYDFTPEKVSKKWHNITITYQKNADRDPGSVNWEFFDDMHAVFRNKKIYEENSIDYSEPEPKQNGVIKRKVAHNSNIERYLFMENISKLMYFKILYCFFFFN